MSLSELRNFVKPSVVYKNNEFAKGTIGDKVIQFGTGEFDFDTTEPCIALLGIDEGRGCKFQCDYAMGSDVIRFEIASLMQHYGKHQIIDLGNLIVGKTVNDTYMAVSLLCAELIRNNIFPIIFGGSQDLIYGQYGAYKQLAQIINITNIDARFDLGEPEEGLNSQSYLGHIIMEQPNYLFNYSHIGHQTYFTGEDAIEKMTKLYFDSYRLGYVRKEMQDIEPVFRNTDLLSFDIASIRNCDAMATYLAAPNGLYAEEACQLTFYAGLSEKVTSFGVHNYVPSLDINQNTAKLVAQMVWYYIDGFNKRKNEFPAFNKNGFLKYIVSLSEIDNELIFLKSLTSDRWWMEIPVPDGQNKVKRQHLVPCSYKDYLSACNNEMPERWWQTFKKLS
ncbi:MAG TPA: formimidoylglutamase [Bacteroidia bacterium]|nr:formimidoylglutamase [Bacteroidia bacterium]